MRLYPRLDLPYGPTPVPLASAGVQRIVLLSYLLVWAWQGHKNAARLARQEPERRLVVLFDEPETHLHPQWQRRLLPALRKVTEALEADPNTRQAELEPVGFAARGDVVNWLVSDTFGLQQARSVPAEEAVEAAERLMRGQADQNPPELRTKEEIDAHLRALLGDRDPFWPRWLVRTGQV